LWRFSQSIAALRKSFVNAAFAIAVVGEYVGKIYFETKARPAIS
jgi:hypothetical protein